MLVTDAPDTWARRPGEAQRRKGFWSRGGPVGAVPGEQPGTRAQVRASSIRPPCRFRGPGGSAGEQLIPGESGSVVICSAKHFHLRDLDDAQDRQRLPPQRGLRIKHLTYGGNPDIHNFPANIGDGGGFYATSSFLPFIPEEQTFIWLFLKSL